MEYLEVLLGWCFLYLVIIFWAFAVGYSMRIFMTNFFAGVFLILMVGMIGAIILTVALSLELYHDLNIYNWIGMGCLVSFFSIYEVKKYRSKVIVIKE